MTLVVIDFDSSLRPLVFCDPANESWPWRWIGSGYLPGFHLFQVRGIDPKDEVEVLIPACNWKPVGLRHPGRPVGTNVNLYAAFFIQRITTIKV